MVSARLPVSQHARLPALWVIRSVLMRRISKLAIHILVCSAEGIRAAEHEVNSNQVKNLIRSIRNTKQQT